LNFREKKERTRPRLGQWGGEKKRESVYSSAVGRKGGADKDPPQSATSGSGPKKRTKKRPPTNSLWEEKGRGGGEKQGQSSRLPPRGKKGQTPTFKGGVTVGLGRGGRKKMLSSGKGRSGRISLRKKRAEKGGRCFIFFEIYKESGGV